MFASSDELRHDPWVPWLVIGLVTFATALIAYQTIRPRQRRRKDYDAGAVSEHWLAEQSRQADDQNR